MSRKICIIDGHPDGDARRLIHALCNAYAEGAAGAGHVVTRINICDLAFPLLEANEDFKTPPPEPILSEREKIRAADHVVIAFPLWLGGMPAKLRAFFEQAARAEFFLGRSSGDAGWPAQMMKGKSARTIITMGMPGLVYRFVMDAGALKALERGVLGLSGFMPVNHTILGGAGDVTPDTFRRWSRDLKELGRTST